jgi:uncharacterized membrane protein YphA (DoxX/SURF4 family)
MKISYVLYWTARIIAALIMLQTLYFKFSGAKESIELFTQLGIEPWGRIGTGIFELIASILLLLPSTVWVGSILGIGLMSGAIFSHLTVIGVLRNDGGQLFYYAVITLACCLFSFWKSKSEMPEVLKKLLPSFLK